MPRLRRAAAIAVAAGALAVSAACGGSSDEAADQPPEPVTAAPVPVFEPASPGEEVRPGTQTPGPVARAIAGPKVVVVAFLLRGAADDDSVGAAVRALRASPAGRRGVAYFVYDVSKKPGFGDLPQVLGVDETPTVAVIGRDRVLTNRWVGLVDTAILRQSVADAKAAPRAPGPSPAPSEAGATD